MSFGLSAMNATRGHHLAHYSHSHHNRQEAHEGGTKKEARATHGTYFLGQKLFEFGVAGWLGYMEGYSGEPMFFSSNPATAVGLKFLGLVVLNTVEIARIWFDHSFQNQLGAKAGAFFDGALAGTTSAFTVAWTYDYANSAGNAKRAAETPATPPAKTTGGVDYSKSRPRQLGAPAPKSAPQPDRDLAAAVERANRLNADIYAEVR